MTVNTGGSAAALELAAGLLALRQNAGLSTRELGARIDASPANISHWENAGRLPSEERLGKIFDALQVEGDERERLLGLRREAAGPGQLNVGLRGVSATIMQLIDYERNAVRIVDASLGLIPGLLQTGDYARATLQGRSDSELYVTLRAGRRDILTRVRNPVELIALIDSEALVRPVAPPAVMRDQYEHILRLIERPNVTVRVVSSTRPGYHPLLGGPFELIEFGTAKPVVLLDHHPSAAFLYSPDEVAEYVAAANVIQKVAMTPAQSAEAIAEIVKGMEMT